MYTSSMEDRRTQLKKLLRSGRIATPQQRFSTVRLCMARYAPGLPAADAATKASGGDHTYQRGIAGIGEVVG